MSSTNINELETMSIEELLEVAGKDLRCITIHSDGRVHSKSGGSAKFPKRLYTAKPSHGELYSYGELVKKSIIKLIKDNHA